MGSIYLELSSLSGASAVSWCVDERKAIDYASKNTVAYQFKDNIDNNLFRDIWVNVGIDDLLPDPTGKEKYYPDDGLFTRHDGGVFVAWEPSLPLSKYFGLNLNLAPIMVVRFEDRIVLFSQASLFISYKRFDSKKTNLGVSAYLGYCKIKCA